MVKGKSCCLGAVVSCPPAASSIGSVPSPVAGHTLCLKVCPPGTVLFPPWTSSSSRLLGKRRPTLQLPPQTLGTRFLPDWMGGT